MEAVMGDTAIAMVDMGNNNTVHMDHMEEPEPVDMAEVLHSIAMERNRI